MSVITESSAAVARLVQDADKRIETKERPQISQEMMRKVERAEIFARSGFFSDVKQVAQAVVKMEIAEELGIPAISAMTSIHVFGDDGKKNIQIGAHLLAAQIRKSGRYNYKIIENTIEKCVIEFYGKGFLTEDDKWNLIGIETYTIDDAKRADLNNKQNWRKYPADMLYARCIARGQRKHAPDALTFTAYVPEEFDENMRPARETGTYDPSIEDAVEVAVSPENEVLDIDQLEVSEEQNRGHGEEGLGVTPEPVADSAETARHDAIEPDHVPDDETAVEESYEPPAQPKRALMDLLTQKAGGNKEIAKLFLGQAAMDFFNKALKSANDLTADEALQIHKAVTLHKYSFGG